MGRRKRAKKIIRTQMKPKVAKVFKCPFCAHDKAVECKMDRQRQIASLCCKICSVRYQSTINYLSEPIDIFSEWLDKCAEGEEQQENLDEYEED